MEIHPLASNMLPQAAQLWALSFNYPGQDFWLDYGRNELSEVYAAIENGEPQALVGIIDFETRLGGVWIPCAGIAAVACNPARRGEHLVKDLLAHCMQVLHDREIAISTLGTGIHSFYEKFGWAASDWKYSIEMSSVAFKSLRCLGRGNAYRMVSVENLDEVKSIHERWSEQFSLSMRRSDYRWKRRLDDPEFAGQFFVHSDGYMLIDLKQSTEENLCVISEWAYLTPEAYFDGLALMSKLGSQYKIIRWRDPDPEAILKHGIPSPKPKISVELGSMARVVNLQTFRNLFPELPANLQVYDPLGVTLELETNSLNIEASYSCDSVDPSEIIPQGSLTPGNLIQAVTGFWSEQPRTWPCELQSASRLARPFTIERY